MTASASKKQPKQVKTAKLPPKPVTFRDYVRSFLIGGFYGVFIFVLDRTVHLKGALNVSALVLMAIIGLVITIGTIRVAPDSKYAMPTKVIALIPGFFVVAALLYAYCGNMDTQKNFVQELAESKVMPAPLQKPLDEFVAFGRKHELFKSKITAKKTGKP